MNPKRKLFFRKNPYSPDKGGTVFLDALKENLRFHMRNCPDYAAILEKYSFDIDSLQKEDDLYKIPVIPSLYLKRNRLFSINQDKLALNATSTGTQGLKSIIGFDRKTLCYGIVMMLRFFAYHKVISIVPVNYIILGYEPSRHTQMGAIKTAYGTTKFTPALHREYALKDNGKDYELNMDGIKSALFRYAKQGFPVRFVGFPSYMFFLVKKLKENNIRLKLNKKSKVLLGGGWKEFTSDEIDRDIFYGLIKETLGIDKKNCLEFFSTVEHPLPYCKCENGHFHVPVYSRVIIRDTETLLPVPDGEMGLLSFISPLVSSMPLTSIVTDDIAVMHKGSECSCNIKTPYFDLLGRAGIRQIKTCTAEASEILGGKV